jgi:hypothetical protein
VPARTAANTNASSYIVSTHTAMCGLAATIRRDASIPSRPGRLRSITTTSACMVCAAVTAPIPSSASETTSQPSWPTAGAPVHSPAHSGGGGGAPGDARKRIVTFLVLTLLFTAVSASLAIGIGLEGNAGDLIALAVVWSPGVAALITVFAFQRNLKGIGWRLGKPRYLLIGYGLPLVECTFVYGVPQLARLTRHSSAAGFRQCGIGRAQPHRGRPVDTGVTEYIVDEFGFGFVVSGSVIAYIFWRLRHHLPPFPGSDIQPASAA